MPFDACDEPYEIAPVGDVSGLAVLPERTATLPKKAQPIWPMPEGECLRRLEEAQKLLRLPPSVWEVLVEVIAPDPGDDVDDGAAKPLPEPTDALPATEEKAEVLAARVRAGQQLWHPDDATWDDPEDAHTEQVGQVLRNGAIKRTKCKVAHRDGASIVIPHDPEEAVDTLRRHFRFAEMQEIAGLLWEGVGYQPRRAEPPQEQQPPKKKRGQPKKNASTSDKDKRPEESTAVDPTSSINITTTPTPTPEPEVVETPATTEAVEPVEDAAPLTSDERRAMWGDRIARQRASKLTVLEFCRREGCGVDTFYKYRRKIAEEQKAARTSARERKATEQAEKSAQQTDQPAKQVRQAMQNPPAIVTPVEIVLPCGAVLRVQQGTDVAFIGNLARTLGK